MKTCLAKSYANVIITILWEPNIYFPVYFISDFILVKKIFISRMGTIATKYLLSSRLEVGADGSNWPCVSGRAFHLFPWSRESCVCYCSVFSSPCTWPSSSCLFKSQEHGDPEIEAGKHSSFFSDTKPSGPMFGKIASRLRSPLLDEHLHCSHVMYRTPECLALLMNCFYNY